MSTAPYAIREIRWNSFRERIQVHLAVPEAVEVRGERVWRLVRWDDFDEIPMWIDRHRNDPGMIKYIRSLFIGPEAVEKFAQMLNTARKTIHA